MNTDQPYGAAMARAIAESRAAMGVSSPNPPVGAVIVDDAGAVLGVGHTQAAGGAHAEIMALREAGDRARGATAVVTLEPCDHTGRTGPCTRALIDAGIARVVFAVSDPNPEAADGADTLRKAGIDVIVGVGGGEAFNGPLRGWLHRQETGRPCVIAKTATTIDGRVAAADGTSRWITGEGAREDAHRVRAGMDAIVVGTGTALADNPSLTARKPDGSLYEHQPTRIVVGKRELPDDAAVLDDSAPTKLVRSHDPHDVLAAVPDALNVLVEGGPAVLGAFLAAGLVDEVHAYIAPTILGAGANAVDDSTVSTLAEAHRFVIVQAGLVTPDADVKLVLRRHPDL
ncbi:MAG: bifunctional diaminohydroxyphosphoribosylaminopyrimidine deaminase/5-amino-6-(5-phosphoribosylamino)uracil reductase RibD [Gordonia sp. (in: high G+C Gram-positive bacteria)]|uniref:bifunctional diaminohydroxyphosphoribosylaminopyrimidine deaminase/5-amino-6-(5-phosphoribosylamino)uracil reductase RibD n=1 Tax=Gordonia sp. (in: high G+C Gram-positive bacteria) TaxID=84139 RepID=UPI0039E55D82